MSRQTLLLALIAALWAAVVLYLNLGNWKLDLSAIYFAALSFSEGRLDLVYAPGPWVYLTEPPAEWVQAAEAQGVQDATFTPYLYPPLWAALLAPVAARVDAQMFMDAVLVVMVASTVWMVWLAYRLVAARGISPTAWAALSFLALIAVAPGYMSYWFGQPQVIVSAITLASVVALGRGRDVAAGGLLALAAAAKLSPALLIVLFVMEGRWRALGAFALFGAALGGLSILLAGWPLHETLLTKLALVEERILISHIVVSLELALFQLSEVLTGAGLRHVEVAQMVMEPLWITITVRVTLIVGVVVTWWATRDTHVRFRLWARFFALTLVFLVTNPLAWVHYLILPLALLPGLFEVMERRRAALWTGLAVVPMSLPVFLKTAAMPHGASLQFALHLAVAGGLFVLVLTRTYAQANPTPDSRRKLLPPRAPSL